MPEFPHLLHTAIDTTHGRGPAEFYREFLGLRYRPGDEPPADGSEDDDSWLVLVDGELKRHKGRAIALGASVLLDRTRAHEPLYVLADPAGHPFCILTH